MFLDSLTCPWQRSIEQKLLIAVITWIWILHFGWLSNFFAQLYNTLVILNVLPPQSQENLMKRSIQLCVTLCKVGNMSEVSFFKFIV